MIIKHWARYFRRRYGFTLPNDYLAFDLETTGFGADDLITEIGHACVKDRKLEGNSSVILNWADHPDISEPWLRGRLEMTRQHIEFDKNGSPTGARYNMSIERMREEGLRPEMVLGDYLHFFRGLREEGVFFVGHNARSFDSRRFTEACQRWLGEEWVFGGDELFDTGAIEKASQLEPPLLPFPEESLETYFLRVCRKYAKGVRWSVAYCLSKYQLCEKYGLDRADCHGAAFDSRICHLLFEEYRDMAGETELNLKLKRRRPVDRPEPTSERCGGNDLTGASDES